MSGLLGAAAGLLMIVTALALLLAFCVREGLCTRAFARRNAAVCGYTIACGALYWLAAALIHTALYGAVDFQALSDIFKTRRVRAVLEALPSPGQYAMGAADKAFAWLAHAAGKALFSAYASAGVALCFAMTCAANCLLAARADRILPDGGGKAAVSLALALPGAVFLFLPGWPPLAYLLGAALLYILTARCGRIGKALSPAVWQLALTLSGLLSAAVVYAAATGVWA